MSLTRSMLNGMGLTGEQISAIIEAHTESTDALKAQRDEAKAQAEEFKAYKKELEDYKSTNDSEWKAKFDKVTADFDKYKTEQANKETKAAITAAYKDLLINAGISEKRIGSVLKVADLSKLELEDGKIKNADELTENIKTEWSDFIVSTETKGADVSHPPKAEPVKTDFENMSMAEYVAARKKG